MLRIDLRHIHEGVIVFGDDTDFNKFYLLPNEPRYHLDADGKPVFTFIKYTRPIDRAAGKKGGGFLIFDVEFVVPEEKRAKILQQLDEWVRQYAISNGIRPLPVEIGDIIYISGQAVIKLFNSSADLVETAFTHARPSLFGNNITSVAIELTPEGATLAEKALQGKGGTIQVVYTLKFWAKLPPLKVHGWFDSPQFYQTIKLDSSLWGEDIYRETIREQVNASKAINATVEYDLRTGSSANDDPDSDGDASSESSDSKPIDQKIVDEVYTWAMDMVQEAAEKQMIAILSPGPNDQRKRPEDIEDVARDIEKTQIGTFHLNYTHRSVFEYRIRSQGTLPIITNLLDKDGKPLQWDDYAMQVDLDDPFFKQLRVDAYLTADFTNLPIHSVEVKLIYDGKPMPNLAKDAPEGEAMLSKAGDISHFSTYINETLDEDRRWKYKYSYRVHYKGTSQIYQSPEIEEDDGTLAIGVDDVGILSVGVAASDLNWSLVDSVQVRMSYEDQQANVGPLEDNFVLTQTQPTHKFEQVFLQPLRKSYKYQIKYFMKDGKEYQVAEQENRSKNLFINDPFSGTKTIKVIAVGDLKNRIQNIFVDLNYTDQTNNYIQNKSIALNTNTPFQDWTFPVISDTQGEVTYSGTVVLAEGTVRMISRTIATGSTILFPKAPVGSVTVVVATDRLEFMAYKLVRLSLTYQDDPNLILERKDFIFTANNKSNQIWRVSIYDPANTKYAWEATFFMNDNTVRRAGSTTATDPTLILQVPTA